jgi:hypothetical protein
MLARSSANDDSVSGGTVRKSFPTADLNTHFGAEIKSFKTGPTFMLSSGIHDGFHTTRYSLLLLGVLRTAITSRTTPMGVMLDDDDVGDEDTDMTDAVVLRCDRVFISSQNQTCDMNDTAALRCACCRSTENSAFCCCMRCCHSRPCRNNTHDHSKIHHKTAIEPDNNTSYAHISDDNTRIRTASGRRGVSSVA